MKKSAQKIQATTQDFIGIQDVVGNVVIQSSGNACLIIEIKSTNFPLLSAEEQGAKILSYAALLNSLSFPIQIFIRGKKIDISSYLNLLSQEAEKTQNKKLSEHITLYKDFVQTLVKVNTVLDKKFYIIIPYSYLEGGMIKSSKDAFINKATEILNSKARSLHAELARVGLNAKTLNEDDLVKLFYEIYNEEPNHSISTASDMQAPIVKTGGRK